MEIHLDMLTPKQNDIGQVKEKQAEKIEKIQ